MQLPVCGDEVELLPEIDRCADVPGGYEDRISYGQGGVAVMLEHGMFFTYLDDLEAGTGKEVYRSLVDSPALVAEIEGNSSWGGLVHDPREDERREPEASGHQLIVAGVPVDKGSRRDLDIRLDVIPPGECLETGQGAGGASHNEALQLVSILFQLTKNVHHALHRLVSALFAFLRAGGMIVPIVGMEPLTVDPGEPVVILEGFQQGPGFRGLQSGSVVTDVDVDEVVKVNIMPAGGLCQELGVFDAGNLGQDSQLSIL